jgi:hypothetical protein
LVQLAQQVRQEPQGHKAVLEPLAQLAQLVLQALQARLDRQEQQDHRVAQAQQGQQDHRVLQVLLDHKVPAEQPVPAEHQEQTDKAYQQVVPQDKYFLKYPVQITTRNGLITPEELEHLH